MPTQHPIFGCFSLLSYFFDISKLKIDLKTSIFIKRKILEALFSPPNSTFSPPFPSSIFSNYVVFRTYVTQFKCCQSEDEYSGVDLHPKVLIHPPDFKWPHLNPIFPYFFTGFLTIIYKKPYKKQGFLIQFAKLDTFPGSTKKFPKNIFGNFRPFFAITLFFWPFQIKDLPQNINFH